MVAAPAAVPAGPVRAVPDLDLLVVGSGVAGLSAAVRASSAGMRVGVLTKGELVQSATRWAQGGVAAVLGGDEDSTDAHLADTLRAGAGLCDIDAVRILVDEGPGRVNELIALGADFDLDPEGGLALAREGGHSHARVVHAGGAATGAEIERALVAAVQRSAAALLEHRFAVGFVIEQGHCRGVRAIGVNGEPCDVRAANVLMASGGAGQLYSVTTNPPQSTGDGIAMALAAGVAVADIEFMQFHPTALHHPAMPRPLLSEALRGHGALIRDHAGERFVDELLPRDQVARAMTARMLETGTDHCWLDATALDQFVLRFPTIAASLAAVGLDPSTDWLPIAPAAHYLSGGVITDLDGATTMPGLWACGEVACTGVHGANRLASNSLLEGMVFAPRVIEAIVSGRDGARSTGAMAALGEERSPGAIPSRPVPWRWPFPGGPPTTTGVSATTGVGVSTTTGVSSLAAPPTPNAALDWPKLRDRLQRAMTTGAGVVRSEASLAEVDEVIAELATASRAAADSADAVEVRNLVLVAGALVAAARQRTETRGAHTRIDHPQAAEAFRCRLVIR